VAAIVTKKLDRRHPLLQRKYAIWTPPSFEMIETIGDWIDQGISGGHIYGPSRFGKSRTIKWYLKAELEKRFKCNLPLVTWIRRESKMGEREFWNELLSAANFEFNDPLKQKPKNIARFLFEQQLLTLARIAKDNYAMLLINEAQVMTLKEWLWLLGLQNSLDDQEIRFCIVSIGSYELQYQPDYLARTGNPHIAARFFASDMRFRGIASSEELSFVLNGYDVDSEWPQKSGASYLNYFALEDFEKGQRLSSCGSDIWAAFNDLLPSNLKGKRSYEIELPMQRISHTIEQALRRLGEGEDWETVTDYKSWLQMIAKTRFTDHIKKSTRVTAR
jgi:hypothetical protein